MEVKSVHGKVDPMASRRTERRALGTFPRTARINELLREVLADELEKFSDTDGRLRLVTVTGVEVFADLAGAKVYMSFIDGPVSEALGEHRLSLQGAIARQVRMKRTPKLQFVADPAVVQGERIEEILRRLKNGGRGESGGVQGGRGEGGGVQGGGVQGGRGEGGGVQGGRGEGGGVQGGGLRGG
jgi:ribosome-binding factor A